APTRWPGRLSFGCPLVVSTVVAHDGGVRLICAGWIPQDDDSDVNVTAVYRRASLTTSLNRVVAPRFSADWFTHRVNAVSPASQVLRLAVTWSPATSTSLTTPGRPPRWPQGGSCRAR